MRPSLPGLLAAAATLSAAKEQCYYLGGDLATDWNYQPCPSNETIYSTCCVFQDNETCQPDGMCRHPDGAEFYDYRAACTDQDWTGCQEICPKTKENTWVKVVQCGGGNNYCCNKQDNQTCCTDGSEKFQLQSPQPAASPSPIPPDPNPPSNGGFPGSGHGLSQGAIGGIAGGVCGGVAVVAAIVGWWFVRRRRRRRAMGEGLGKQTAAEVEGKPMVEAGGTGLVEADGGVLAEADGGTVQRPVHELEG